MLLTNYLMISLLVQYEACLLTATWIWRPLEDHRMNFYFYFFKTAFTLFSPALRSVTPYTYSSQRKLTHLITFHSCSGPESPKESLLLTLYISSQLSVEQGDVRTGRVVIKYTRIGIYSLDFHPNFIFTVEQSSRRHSINTCWLHVWSYPASLFSLIASNTCWLSMKYWERVGGEGRDWKGKIEKES